MDPKTDTSHIRASKATAKRLVDSINSAAPSPGDFMRKRRPERFSDSRRTLSPAWHRPPLEYHLESITSRSSEIDFEKFAIALLKKTVCPNVSQQTGPMGGGDGKVDADTYTVADGLSLYWTASDEALAGAKERWAIAVSAKMDWKSKLRADIKKISDSDRGYKRAFFVSSKFIPAKDKHHEQDALSKKYGISITIFDREWILDAVLGKNLESLFSEHLKYVSTASSVEVRMGPNDALRIQEIENKTARMDALIADEHGGPELARLALETALLTRGLERSRHEVDAAFAKALRSAAKDGGTSMVLECYYNMAWTAAWWFEDWESFISFYFQYKNLLGPNSIYEEAERLFRLWTIVITQARAGRISLPKIELSEITKFVKSRLEAFSIRKDMPNSSLSAKTTLALMELIMNPSNAPGALGEIRNCIKKADGKIGFSVSDTTEMVAQLESVFGDLPEYAVLYDELVVISTVRSQAGETAKLLMRRFAGLSKRGHSIEALIVAGRAISSLKAGENPYLLSLAFGMLSSIYEDLGLPWAARAACLNAFSISLTHGFSLSKISPQQEKLLNSLKWIEIKLGWTAQALECHLMENSFSKVMRADHCESERYEGERTLFDGAVAIQMLRADVDSIKRAAYFPDNLDRLDLFFAASAARHALGHPHELPEEMDHSIDWFEKILSQPMAEQLKCSPIIPGGVKVRITAVIAGCSISIVCDDDPIIAIFAKSLAAFLETFLATCMSKKIIPRTPLFDIVISRQDSEDDPELSYATSMAGSAPALEFLLKCKCEFVDGLLNGKKNIIREACFSVIAHAYLIDDFHEQFTAMADADSGFARAVDASGSISAEIQVYGKIELSKSGLFLQEKMKAYTYIERERRRQSEGLRVTDAAPLSMGEGNPPEDLNLHSTAHDAISMPSLIRPHLWDAAKWIGIGFIGSEDGSAVPGIVIIFTHQEPARLLWNELAKDTAKTGRQDALRVSILLGISEKHKHHYRVALMPGESWFRTSGNRVQVLIGRANTMTPDGDGNLNRFIEHYRRHGKCLLFAATLVKNQPFVASAESIEVNKIFVRNAYEVGPNDFDSPYVNDDDDVIIPTSLPDAPVTKLRAANAKRRPIK